MMTIRYRIYKKTTGKESSWHLQTKCFGIWWHWVSHDPYRLFSPISLYVPDIKEVNKMLIDCTEEEQVEYLVNQLKKWAKQYFASTDIVLKAEGSFDV